MKISLISPVTSMYPVAIGIRILSACLKRAGHQVQLIFFPKLFDGMWTEKTIDDVLTLVGESRLIGISLMTDDFKSAVQITQVLKRIQNIPIVWGGIHPTMRPLECLDYADMVCLGEAEETLPELANKIENGQNICNIEGLWLKSNGKIIKNVLRLPPHNLDAIPFQDYDFQDHYILVDRDIRRFDADLMRRYFYNGYYITLTSRGCPYNCTYCWNHANRKMYPMQQTIRRRSIDNIIKELSLIKNKFPFLNKICIGDDAFFINSENEIIEFAKEYKEKVGLPLVINGITPGSITEKKLSSLIAAGMTSIRMGIQTASERTKQLYKRVHNNKQIEKDIKTINMYKNNMAPPHYDIILDNPWETEDDLSETLMFLSRMPTPYVLSFSSLTFYPGTELYEKAKKEGIEIIGAKGMWSDRYMGNKKNYFNRVLWLLSQYTQTGNKISPLIMFLLTNKFLRKMKFSFLLYTLLARRLMKTSLLKNFLINIQMLLDKFKKSELKLFEKLNFFFIFFNQPLIIESFGPKETKIDTSFNIQPNGMSALWFKLYGLSSTCQLVFNGKTLEIDIDSDIVSAYISKEIYSKKGKYEFYFLDEVNSRRSNSLFFITR